MIKVLVCMAVDEGHRQLLEGVSEEVQIIYKPSKEVTAEDLKDVQMIVGNISPQLLKEATQLKLMQLNSAGTDGYCEAGVLPEGALLANATGSYGLAIAEHMLGMLLVMMKHLDLYRLNQINHEWKDEGTITSIDGSQTLVVGLGDIGKEFASRMVALGSTVTGIKRTANGKPDYVSALYQMDHLYECLEKADIVAASLPGTKATYHLFNQEAFSHMKPGAFFINVGRGNGVDSMALCDALNSGHLAGAALDVTEIEPLPKDHPLWNAKNIFITPHISGGYHLKSTHDKIINIAVTNLKHLVNNEPFENLVDMTTGYRKSV